MHTQVCADTAAGGKVNQKSTKQLNDNMWSEVPGIVVTEARCEMANTADRSWYN